MLSLFFLMRLLCASGPKAHHEQDALQSGSNGAIRYFLGQLNQVASERKFLDKFYHANFFVENEKPSAMDLYVQGKHDSIDNIDGNILKYALY